MCGCDLHNLAIHRTESKPTQMLISSQDPGYYEHSWGCATNQLVVCTAVSFVFDKHIGMVHLNNSPFMEQRSLEVALEKITKAAIESLRNIYIFGHNCQRVRGLIDKFGSKTLAGLVRTRDVGMAKVGTFYVYRHQPRSDSHVVQACDEEHLWGIEDFSE